MWCMHILNGFMVWKRAVPLSTSQSISTHWWLRPWSIVLNESAGFYSNINTQTHMGRCDEIIQRITNTVTCQLSGILILGWKSLSNKTRSTWWYQISGTNRLVNDNTQALRQSMCTLVSLSCLVLFIRHPLSFDLVCHHPLHLTHLNHVLAIEMLWKIDSIII